MHRNLEPVRSNWRGLPSGWFLCDHHSHLSLLTSATVISPFRLQNRFDIFLAECRTNLLSEVDMPERETLERAHEDAREGKSSSTQAGEFVREEMHHIREGKHGAASAKQAIAIGLSKARRAGVKLQTPKRGVSAKTKQQASRDSSKGQSSTRRKPSATRSRATRAVLKKEGHSAASPKALAKQARAAAKKRGPVARHRSAMKASRTRKART